MRENQNFRKETMNILVIGSGGREHALVKALKRSKKSKKIFCAPGNAGIAKEATCIDLNGSDNIVSFCKKEFIDLVVIGPEQPLVDGLADDLRDAEIRVFGPSQGAAQLEASKGFTKDICAKYNIPTGAYGRFTEIEPAIEYLSTLPMPIVIKADGLAAGKGVVICTRRREAERVIEEMFAGKFGKASESIVIEEFLDGEEISFFALCDGNTAVEFGSAQDHKAVGEGDTGPNTGGMGTYCPAPIVTQALRKQIMRDIIQPTVEAMKAEGMPYTGILFAGLMITREGPKLIEYNVRFGDPEAQVLLTRLEDDLAELLSKAAEGKLPKKPITFTSKAALCVVMASSGYPGTYEKGTEIRDISQAESMSVVIVYHAGTTEKDGTLLATGGRVLGVTALGRDVSEAQQRAYQAVDSIDWPNGFCRRDIGWRAVQKKAG
jgi:phosphoribosylamine--glycine ligase